MDGVGNCTQETQTVFKVPNARIRERVPFQRVRVETEEMGAGTQLKPNGEASEDMVSEQKNEKQEELTEASGSAAEQQQLNEQQR